MRTGSDDRQLGELFADLAGQTGALVRDEIALAKAEMKQAALQASRGVGAMVIGGVVIYAGFLALLGAVALLLTRVLPDWLAALIVGIVVAAAGAALIGWGRTALARTDAVPRQTLATLATDVEVVKGDRA